MDALKMPYTHGAMSSALFGLGLIDILGTWGRSAMDGTLLKLFDALHNDREYILPGTDQALRITLTGISWLVDYPLRMLIIFFWEAVDGSHPSTSAIGVYFIGQLLPTLVAFYTDHIRNGAGPSIMRPTLWVLTFQLVAIGCTSWIWAVSFISSYLTTSTTISLDALQKASLSYPRMTLSIFPTLVIGYLTPVFAMALPSPAVVTNSFQQVTLAAWNMFPLTVGLLLKLVSVSNTWVHSRHLDVTDGQRQSPISHHQHLASIRWTNALSLVVSCAMHVGVLFLCMSSSFSPNLWSPEYAQELTLASVFMPSVSISQVRMVGDGVRSFMLWDQVASYPVMVLIMLVQLRTALKARGQRFN